MRITALIGHYLKLLKIRYISILPSLKMGYTSISKKIENLPKSLCPSSKSALFSTTYYYFLEECSIKALIRAAFYPCPCILSFSNFKIKIRTL